MCLGIVVLSGWALNIDAFKSLLPDLISMKPNSAVCFMLGGIALATPPPNSGGWFRRVSGSLPAAMLLLLGGISWLQYLFDFDTGIDKMLFEVPPGASYNNVHPARMTPQAALSFSVLGGALLMLKTHNAPRITQGLALAILILALSTMISYLFGLGALPAMPSYKPMAIHTAFGFLILSSGILALTVDIGLLGRLRKKLPNLILAFAASLLLLSAAATLANMFRAWDLGHKHIRMYEVLLRVEKIATEIELNISAYRGYVITGQDRFTEPLEASRSRLATTLAEIHQLIDNAQQEQQLAILEELIKRRIAMCDEKIQLRKQNGADVAATAVATGQGETLNLELRRRMNDFIATEKANLSQQETRAKASNKTALIALIVTLLAGLLLMLMVLAGLKRAQAVLQQFKTTLDLTRDCVFMFNPDNLKFFYINQGAIDQVGYSAEEMLKMTPPDIKPEFDEARFRAMIAPMLAGEIPLIHFETLHRHKDGHDINVEIALQYVAPANEAPRFIAIVRDISERKCVENRLRASEASLKEAQRLAQIGNWELDLVHGHLLWSEEVFRIFEIDASQFGASYEAFLQTIHPEDRELVNRTYLASVNDHDDYNIVHRLLMADGRIKFVRERGETVYENSKPIRSIGTVQDVTEIRLAEEELLQYRNHLESMVKIRTAELEAVNEELEAFAYSVSHDLRAPLRSIDGFSQALLEDYQDKLDNTGRDYLLRVRAASQRMGVLIDELLKLSRITRATLKPCRIDLSAMARDVVHQFRDAAPDHHAEVAIQPGLTVNGDPGLMQVALENLLGNAWKYSAKQAAPRIELGCCSQNNETVYYVRDNGAGFDMQYADKLFGAFQRLHHRNQFEGNGIGLATVKRIIHRHGGRIWAESEPDKQTTFYFTVPEERAESNTTTIDIEMGRVA